MFDSTLLQYIMILIYR